VNETDVAVLGQRLIDAARLGRVEAARTLVAMGADLNVRSTEQKREGWAPIFFAATAGRTATAALLIRLGADPNARDRFNATALHYAADRGKVALRHT
jgi:26S proteasome non-ATPase regulatory subunit 10